MSFGKGQPTKLVAKFSWAKVDTDLVRKMLVEYSNTCGVNAPSTLDDNRLKVSPPETLTRLAEVYLGSPPRSDVFDSSMTDLLREEWLPRASARVVAEVYHYVNLADPDGTYHRTKQERVHFLATRRKTVTFINRLRTLFINQHKDRTPTRSGTRRSGDAIAPTALVGSGAKPPKALHGYQLEAQRNLDALIRAAQPSDRRGVLVFPTGAGKTATVVSWALQKMVEQPELRILWVAHQQELLSQAVRVFREWAPTCPPEFVRTAREIHAFGSAKETLASAETDIAAITIHSLASNLDRHKQQRITTFLSRPTIVFIDEAHRAAAPTYQDLLTLLGESPSVLGIVGLTATPWPSAANAKTLFNRSFPTVVHRVEQEELIASGVLAQPVLHSIDTNLLMPLTAEEITATTNGGEIPPSVLKRLNVEQRNRCIRKVWDSSPEQWGKTLVFATSIEHAEELGEIFADVEHRVLHSQSLDSPQSALAWFRTTKGPAVLISVGMLTEGVDLPQARTAFLARPTASRILLRQMIGRVLRGPAANGDAFANLVNFRDVWTNFGEILDPSDVIRHLGRSSGDGSDRPPRGNARAEDGGEVPSDVEAEIQRQLEAFRAKINEAIEREPSVASIDPLITCVRLVGYYQLPDRVIPVFDHQLHPIAELQTTTHASKKKRQANQTNNH
ncbi:MAG: DEAD/DEAH box helicase, partial [Acidimicrobiia bacterium]